jgi:hypothetical protein
MQPDDYTVVKEWYETQKHFTDWDFKTEMVKYSRSDVEVLSRAVLAFRKLFKENQDVDPPGISPCLVYVCILIELHVYPVKASLQAIQRRISAEFLGSGSSV